MPQRPPIINTNRLSDACNRMAVDYFMSQRPPTINAVRLPGACNRLTVNDFMSQWGSFYKCSSTA